MIEAAVVGDRIGFTGPFTAPAFVADRHADCYGLQHFNCIGCRQPLANLYQVGAHVLRAGARHILAEECSCHQWHPAILEAIQRYLISLND